MYPLSIKYLVAGAVFVLTILLVQYLLYLLWGGGWALGTRQVHKVECKKIRQNAYAL